MLYLECLIIIQTMGTGQQSFRPSFIQILGIPITFFLFSSQDILFHVNEVTKQYTVQIVLETVHNVQEN